MIIQLMGPQACGKGTQGELLSQNFGIPYIGLGDMLRAVPANHKHYKHIQEAMKSGNLVGDAIVADIIRERISQIDCKNGYVLDGYTRDIAQLSFYDPNPDWIILLNIPRQESVRRVSGRRLCEANGEIYNIYTLPPEELKNCPGPLVQREDDKEEAVNRRLDIYYNQTKQVVAYYRAQNKLLEIDGMGTPEQVFSRVTGALEAAEAYKKASTQ